MLVEERVSLNQVAKKIDIQKTTIWRIAQENELVYRKFGEMPNITEKAAEKRLEFANFWAKKDLNNIIFTDESYFHIFRNKLGKWCKKGEKPIVKKLNPKKALLSLVGS